jgi:preprotein translocase subunit SecB
MSVVLGKAQVERGAPYRLRLKLSDVFSFRPNTPADRQERMITVNGPAILYGVARGIVAETTGAGRHGKYVLPSVDLLPMAMRRLERKETPSPTE